MVNESIRPAEQQARPNGRSFFMASAAFHSAYKDLFYQDESLILQVQDEQFSHSLLVDASQPENWFRWQLTTAVNDSADEFAHRAYHQTTEVQVDDKGEISGWHAEFDFEGRLICTTELDSSNWRPAGYTINFIINSRQLTEYTDKARTNLAHHQELLRDFLLNHRSNGIKLSNGKLEAEIKRLESRIKKLGFQAIHLQPKPQPRQKISPQLFPADLFIRFK
ncbi:MAG: hypothetical protein ACXWLH_04705 [Candidatus Saccharimonadales bacterium]